MENEEKKVKVDWKEVIEERDINSYNFKIDKLRQEGVLSKEKENND